MGKLKSEFLFCKTVLLFIVFSNFLSSVVLAVQSIISHEVARTFFSRSACRNFNSLHEFGWDLPLPGYLMIHPY